jgi:hypothetical protein
MSVTSFRLAKAQVEVSNAPAHHQIAVQQSLVAITQTTTRNMVIMICGKAKRHVDMDEEDVQHTSTPDSEENVRYLGSQVKVVHGRSAQRRTLSCCTERLHSEIRTRANQAMP